MIFDAVLGDGLQEYGTSEVVNLNTLVNGFYSPRYAFPFQRINITAEKRIPDVSFYQKLIDWDKFRAQTDAVIIRAGQGSGVDDYFFVNYNAAKKRGMLRGVYWFYDGRVSPSAQADLLVSLLRDNLPEMEIWLDWERNYSGSFEGLQNVVAMMQRVELLLPSVKVGMYTGYYWFIGNSNAISNASQYNYLKSRPLWLAWYTADMSVVKIPQPWSALRLWQFGTPAQGTQYGVATLEIDMSYFSGSSTEFYDLYNGTQPTGETNMILQQVKNAAGLNLRPAVGTTNTPIKIVADGTKVWGNDLGNNWLEISYYQQPTEATATALHCYGYEPLTVSLPYADPPQPAPKPAHTVDVLIDGVNVFHKDLF